MKFDQKPLYFLLVLLLSIVFALVIVAVFPPECTITKSSIARFVFAFSTFFTTGIWFLYKGVRAIKKKILDFNASWHGIGTEPWRVDLFSKELPPPIQGRAAVVDGVILIVEGTVILLILTIFFEWFRILMC